MRVLIVDDEIKAGEVLAMLIKVHVPVVEEIRSAYSGHAASKVLNGFQPNLVFLDIKMPGMTGFEWLASLESRVFEVIFTTAYDQYAIQAIRYAAFDYLLKPVDPEDLVNAFERYSTNVVHHQNRFANLFYNIEQDDPEHFRLSVRTTQATYFLRLDEIIRCSADGNYTHFHLTSSKNILASKPLAHYTGLLPKARFIRCHRSHLVNKDFVDRISKREILLRDGSSVEISRRRMPAVMAALSPS